jgi:hypothetical protein
MNSAPGKVGNKRMSQTMEVAVSALRVNGPQVIRIMAHLAFLLSDHLANPSRPRNAKIGTQHPCWFGRH